MPDLNVIWYCLGAFVALVLAGFGLPPIPEEGVVVAAGAWVASNPEYGVYRWAILPVCVAGILTSDTLLYAVGRHWGSRLLEHRWLAGFLTPEKLAHIQRNFHRYGIKILLFVRWIPGIRSPLFLTAGTMRLPVARFVIADAVAASVGHTLLFMLAYWFTDSFLDLFQRVQHDVDRVRPVLVLLPILAVGLYLLIHFLRKPVVTGDPEEVPLIGSQVAATMEMNEEAPNEEAPPAADGPVTARKPVP